MEEERSAVYDAALHMEACYFVGMRQAFPRHFHSDYVVGLVERGNRRLFCGEREYEIAAGDILLFPPGVSHACVSMDGGTLEYRSFQIPGETMRTLMTDGRLPQISDVVLAGDPETICRLRCLHRGIMSRERIPVSKCRQLFARLLKGRPSDDGTVELEVCRQREDVERICAFLEGHCADSIRLDDLCRQAGMSKSTLLRAFARVRGMTPHCYLESLRVSKAKTLLKQGVPPVEAALQTGFGDQSHFTNCFRRLIGLSPGVYRDSFTGNGNQ